MVGGVNINNERGLIWGDNMPAGQLSLLFVFVLGIAARNNPLI